MTNEPRREKPQTIESILVPTDFGAEATAALDHAIALAKKLDAKIDVIHVWSHMPHPVGGIALEIAGEPPRDVNKITQHNAEEELKELLRRHQDKSDRIDESYLLEGDAAETIVAVANKGKYDLITMGTRGRSGITRAVTGSVAEKVLRHARCPVLMVPGAAVEE